MQIRERNKSGNVRMPGADTDCLMLELRYISYYKNYTGLCSLSSVCA